MYTKLTQIKYTDFAQELIDLGGTNYLDYYTDPGTYEEQETVEGETVTIPTVSIVGIRPSINLNTTKAIQDSNGDIWIDSDSMDDIFC